MTDKFWSFYLTKNKKNTFINLFSRLKNRKKLFSKAVVGRKSFFGREVEIVLIKNLSENIGVFGPRRIGKTSLLNELYKQIKCKKDLKVYKLDCARYENIEMLLKNLAVKMNVNFYEISNLEKFRIYVTQKAEKENSQFLFLLDEVDGLVAYDIQNEEKIFHSFNKMCNKPLNGGIPAARFIIFGFEQIYNHINHNNSSFNNLFVFLPLKSLDKESAFSLVINHMENINIKWQNEEDALYLVDCCSCHPSLLKTVLEMLSKSLRCKTKNQNIIKREDINKIFKQKKFIQNCMKRFYSPKNKRSFKPKGINTIPKLPIEWEKEPFFDNIHKLVILVTAIIDLEEQQKSFTLIDIQKEMKKNKIDISTKHTREIINRLCLNGTLRSIEEETIIASSKEKLHKNIKRIIDMAEIVDKNIFDKFKIEIPDICKNPNEILKQRYEFAVKILPNIFLDSLGSIENCKKELGLLKEKETIEDWIIRSS